MYGPCALFLFIWTHVCDRDDTVKKYYRLSSDTVSSSLPLGKRALKDNFVLGESMFLLGDSGCFSCLLVLANHPIGDLVFMLWRADVQAGFLLVDAKQIDTLALWLAVGKFILCWSFSVKLCIDRAQPTPTANISTENNEQCFVPGKLESQNPWAINT